MISVSEMKYNIISKTEASILSKQGCFAIVDNADKPDCASRIMAAPSQL
jgi:hypothetical protein